MFPTKTLLALASCLAAIVLAEHPFDTRAVDPSIFVRANDINYRLPNHTHPETYDISLSTRVDKNIFDFNGFVRIGIVVDQTTNEIVLHARQLVVSNVRLVRFSGSVPIDVRLSPHNYEVVPEFLRIRTDNINLMAGDRLSLEITYSGTLRADEAGFYRSSYTNKAGARM